MRFTTRWVGHSAAVAAFFATTAVAQAVFPGQNGALTYSWSPADYGKDTGFVHEDNLTQRYLRFGPFDHPESHDSKARFTVADRYPAWSPDGRSFAVSRALSVTRIVRKKPLPWFGEDHEPVTDQKNNIFVGKPGQVPIQVTKGSFYDVSPVFTPDGQRIVFVSNRAGRNDIYITRADGTTRPRRLTATNRAYAIDDREPGGAPVEIRDQDENADNLHPSVSPDGNFIAFDSNRSGKREIYVMGVNGELPTRVTNTPADNFDPDWTPDGKQFVFVSDLGSLPGLPFAGWEIYSMDADGENQTRLTNDHNRNYAPAVSPDGQKILYLASSDLTHDRLALMTIDGSQQRVLDIVIGEGRDPLRYSFHSPTWQPLHPAGRAEGE